MRFTGLILPGMDEVQRHWGWVLALGIGLFVLGMFATSAAIITTFVTVLVLGIVLVVAGIFEIANAFRHGSYGGFWMHLITGVLDIVVGALVIAFPGLGAAALTMVLALYFLVEGLIRTISAFMVSLPHKGLAIFSGVVDVILGVLLLMSWPVSALWFLGLCVGIGLIFRGIWWTSFAFSLRQARKALV